MESSTHVPETKPGLWGWLDDRLGIGGLRYPVPVHANSLAYTLGGLTLVSFIGLIVTGIYVAQFYDPTPARAHASVTYITDTAFSGALIRSVHYWLASVFVITLVLHMVRTFATASFKAPRELTCVTGGAALPAGRPRGRFLRGCSVPTYRTYPVRWAGTDLLGEADGAGFGEEAGVARRPDGVGVEGRPPVGKAAGELG